MSQLPALKDALSKAPIFHQMLGEILEELGGMDFLVDWAESNPTAYVQMLMAAATPPAHPGGGNSSALHLRLEMPAGIQASPLDGETYDNEG